jgi:hypothetical protein
MPYSRVSACAAFCGSAWPQPPAAHFAGCIFRVCYCACGCGQPKTFTVSGEWSWALVSIYLPEPPVAWLGLSDSHFTYGPRSVGVVATFFWKTGPQRGYRGVCLPLSGRSVSPAPGQTGWRLFIEKLCQVTVDRSAGGLASDTGMRCGLVSRDTDAVRQTVLRVRQMRAGFPSFRRMYEFIQGGLCMTRMPENSHLINLPRKDGECRALS